MIVSVEARATLPAFAAHDAACMARSATAGLGPLGGSQASAETLSDFSSTGAATGAATAAAESDTTAAQREIVVRNKRAALQRKTSYWDGGDTNSVAWRAYFLMPFSIGNSSFADHSSNDPS